MGALAQTDGGAKQGDLGSRLGELRQGDWLEIRTLPVALDGASIECHNGVVIVSQTCDLVRANPPTIIVAKVVTLEPQKATMAQKGRSPGFVALSGELEGKFVDLSALGVIDKSAVMGLESIRVFADGVGQSSTSRFGNAIGRVFWRFAFPEDFVPILRPFQERVLKRYDKAASPEGQAFNLVEYIRIEDRNKEPWVAAPYDVVLQFVLPSGELSGSAEGDRLSANDVDRWMRDREGEVVRAPAEIAGRLFPATNRPSAPDREALWQGLVEAWAALCVPTVKAVPDDGAGEGVDTLLSGGTIEAEIYSMSEYSLERYEASEDLDLDHLSGE